MIISSDGFELEFSGSSELELWSFRAESSRTGALQFSSWNRAEIFLRTTIKFPKFYQYHIITNSMIIFMNLYKIKGVLGNWKLWFSYINENFKKIGSFSADFGRLISYGIFTLVRSSKVVPHFSSLSVQTYFLIFGHFWFEKKYFTVIELKPC